MKVIIIDDEPLARGMIKEYLQAYPDLTLVEECKDGFEGLKAIQAHQPDLIFLDIQMPKINGFEMLELIEQPPAVIFTTAFDEYAIKAFEAHAIDYLLKPFSKERFEKALEKCRNSGMTNAIGNTQKLTEAMQTDTNPASHTRVVVKDANKIKIIPVSSIQYLESADDYVKIHTADGTYLKNKTMGYFEGILEAQNFVRIHRSYLVNVQLITRIDPYEKESHIAILSTGSRLPVSKSGFAKLKSILGI